MDNQLGPYFTDTRSFSLEMFQLLLLSQKKEVSFCKEQDNLKPDRTRKTTQNNTRQDKTGPDSKRQFKTGQDKTRQ